jgi:hypothetical protein
MYMKEEPVADVQKVGVSLAMPELLSIKGWVAVNSLHCA